MAKKTFILDTNVLLSDPNALFSFEDNNVVLPLTVIEELDNHKDRQDEVGRNARETTRKLTELTKNHKDLKVGIPIPGGGTLRVLSIDDIKTSHTVTSMPSELSKVTGDNSIVSLCLRFKENEDKDVILVSRDLLLRLKAHFLNITCEDYKKIQAASSVSKLYTGVTTLTDPSFDIDLIYTSGELYVDESFTKDLFPNQFVLIGDGHKEALTRFIGNHIPLKHVSDTTIGKLISRNKEQTFAIDLLNDDAVKLVSLAGFAGCGKSLLAVAAGLEQVLNKKYKSLVICRPIQPVGKDIGFLPGTIDEKMEPWIAPIKDNLRFLLGNTGGTKSKNSEATLQMLFDKGTIEVQAMTYIRGRSIANAFMIIDEAQNLNIHELKTILTRVGEGTKIVLTGDIEQIDNVYVDSLSNGLTVAIEKFKTEPIAGHVTLIKGERSELATLSAKIL